VLRNDYSTTVDGFDGPDPADRSALNRLFYRHRRPTWLSHWVSQLSFWWACLGLPPQSLAAFAAIASQYPVYRIEVASQ